MVARKKEELEKAKMAEDEEDSEEESQDEGEGEKEEGEEDKKPDFLAKMGKYKKGCASKGEDLTEDDLSKSLDKLEALTQTEPPARRQTLLAKAQESELTKSEREELFSLLGQPEQQPAPKVADSITANETIQKSLDVSDFLQEITGELTKSLNALDERVGASDQRQHAFNLILAKALSETGRMVVAMSERLGVIESQPARKPKSAGVVPLEKSFGGQPVSADQVSKSEILNAMSEMIQKSRGIMDDGTDLLVAASKYEQFNQISPNVLAAVQAHMKGGAVH